MSRAQGGIRYTGLGQQITKRITEIYAVPSPLGYSDSTRLKGEDRWEPKGRTAEADALALSQQLEAWLEAEITNDTSRDHLLGLARRATARATSRLRNRGRGGSVSLEARARANDLVQVYLKWLGRSCVHSRMPEKGPVRACPDCGYAEIDT